MGALLGYGDMEKGSGEVRLAAIFLRAQAGRETLLGMGLRKCDAYHQTQLLRFF